MDDGGWFWWMTMHDGGWCWWWTMNDAGWGWRMTMNYDDECQLMCHVWQTSVLIRMLRPVEMYLPCRVCLWNEDAALLLMQLTDDFKQTNAGGSNNAHRSFDTERSRYTQMSSHTDRSFPHIEYVHCRTRHRHQVLFGPWWPWLLHWSYLL